MNASKLLAIIACAFTFAALPATYADAPKTLAWDGRELLAEPSGTDIAIIQEKFNASKTAYNDGDYFWKDPEPYYFVNAKDVVELYMGSSLEQFLKRKEDAGPAEYKEWIEPANYRRIMRAYAELNNISEVAELIDFTNNSYGQINSALFSSDASKEKKETVASVRYLNRALKRISPVEAGATLYRCDHWVKSQKDEGKPAPSYVIELYQKKMEGKTYIHRAFMSTTRGVYSAAKKKFITGCPNLRIIKTKANGNGRDVLGYSTTNAHEEEVLFLPRTNLLVKKLEIRPLGAGKSQLVLYMEEL